MVEEGPAALVGRTVFTLTPHQSGAVLPVDALVPVPDGVPARRATLAANMETALNVRLGRADRPGRPGRRGWRRPRRPAGRLSRRRHPGHRRSPSPISSRRARVSPAPSALVSRDPATSCADHDVVIHTSASAGGLATAIAAAGAEAIVVEASWHGEGAVAVPLGGAFHSRRLRLVSSQVGMVPAERRARWPHRRRLEVAIALLADPALDVLVSGETGFRRCRPRLSGDSRRSRDARPRLPLYRVKPRVPENVRRRSPRPRHDRPFAAARRFRPGAGPARRHLRGRRRLLHRELWTRTASSSTSALRRRRWGGCSSRSATRTSTICPPSPAR